MYPTTTNKTFYKKNNNNNKDKNKTKTKSTKKIILCEEYQK